LSRAQRILLVAPADDLHAKAVAQRISQVSDGAAEPIILDTACFPLGTTASIRITNDWFDGQLELADALPSIYSSIAHESLMTRANIRQLPFDQIDGVWWRRPRTSIVDPAINTSEIRRYVQHNCMRTFESIIEQFGDNRVVVNRPSNERRSQLKPLQLATALKCGMTVPETLISNDRKEIANFAELARREGSGVVLKAVSYAAGMSYPTMIFDGSEEQLARAQLCPTIFQRLVGGQDVRVIVVGDNCFGLLQESSSSYAGVDIRMDSHARFSPYVVPELDAKRLVMMQRRLGLWFGAYDFKLIDGGLCFLEVNPSGQWLWVEIFGEWPIAEVVARSLLYPGNEIQGFSFEPFTSEQLEAIGPSQPSDIFERAIPVRDITPEVADRDRDC
jgi:glutathione synthase/RimK-type ligase-like ATP-grasp enzyme